MSNRRWMMLLAGCALTANVWAAGPTMKVGKISGHAGSSVDLAVKLDIGAASVSGIQFNLTMPPEASIASVKVGDSPLAAGKNVTSSQHGNVWTFILYGLNQNTDHSGTLLVASVKIAASAKKGTYKLAVSNVVYSDPNGKVIPAGSTKDGGLTVN